MIVVVACIGPVVTARETTREFSQRLYYRFTFIGPTLRIVGGRAAVLAAHKYWTFSIMACWLSAAVHGASSSSRSHYFYSEHADEHLTSTYLPDWEALYLREGDPQYPFPHAAGVRELLGALKGVPGLAVHTNPGTTVSEGQGYAMLVAGFRKDVDHLKSLVVGWQAMGQGFAGQKACGGCCSSGGHEEPRHACAAPPTMGSLCRRVHGACASTRRI